MPTSKKSPIGGTPIKAAVAVKETPAARQARHEADHAAIARAAKRAGEASLAKVKAMPKPMPAAKLAAAKAKSAADATELEESAETKAKKLGLKIPKKLAEVADLYFTTRNERLALDKKAEAMKAQEEALKEHLINQLPQSSATSVGGKLCRVTLGSKDIPVAKNWDAVWDYIVKNYRKNPGVVALVQKRLGEATVKEMWEAGKDIPGVEHFTVKTLGVNKL